jgi:hypothetical protein
MLHLIPPKGLCQNLILSPERLCPTAPLEMVMLLLSADLSYSPWVTAAPGISITADLATAHSINVLCKHISAEHK